MRSRSLRRTGGDVCRARGAGHERRGLSEGARIRAADASLRRLQELDRTSDRHSGGDRSRQDLGGAQSAQRRSRNCSALSNSFEPSCHAARRSDGGADRRSRRHHLHARRAGNDTVFRRAQKREVRFARTYLPLDATTAIKFTGGTSGIPKGVMQAYRGWNANIVSQRHAYGFTPKDRYLVNAPLTHGASTYILPILGAGGAFVFPEDTKPAPSLACDCRARGDDVLFAADHGDDAGRGRARSEHVRTPIAAQRDLRRRADACRPHSGGAGGVRSGAGGTPTVRPKRRRSSRISSSAELMHEENLASAGRPSLFTDVGIMDDDGQLAAAGRAGRSRRARRSRDDRLFQHAGRDGEDDQGWLAAYRRSRRVRRPWTSLPA